MAEKNNLKQNQSRNLEQNIKFSGPWGWKKTWITTVKAWKSFENFKFCQKMLEFVKVKSWKPFNYI